MKCYQLKVSLLGAKPTMYFKVQMPESASLHEIHRVIQEVMGWYDYHMHEFSIVGTRICFYPKDEDYEEMMMENAAYFENDVALSSLEGKKIRYVYDFGDFWQMDITFEKTVEDSRDRPVLLAMKGEPPQEDIGGIWAYCEENDGLKSEKLSKEEVEELDDDLFGNWKRSEDAETKAVVPNNARFSLIGAMGICNRSRLFLDPESGMVFSTDDCEYFPRVEEQETDRMIRILPEWHVNLDDALKFILDNGVEEEEHFFIDGAVVLRPDDGLMLEALEASMSEEGGSDHIANLLKSGKIVHNSAGAMLSDLDGLAMAFAEDIMGLQVSGRQYDAFFPDLTETALLAESTVPGCCPLCGGRMSNPRADLERKTGPKHWKLHPIMVTCASCGKNYGILPLGDVWESRYALEGFVAGWDDIRFLFNALRKGPQGRVECVKVLLKLLDADKAAEFAKPLTAASPGSFESALAVAAMYPVGKMGATEAAERIGALSDGSIQDDAIRRALSCIARRIGAKPGFTSCRPKEEIGKSRDPLGTWNLVLASRMRGDDETVSQAARDRLLSKAKKESGGMQMILGEEYSRLCAMHGWDEDLSAYENSNKYSSAFTTFRYRRATAILRKDGIDEAVKEFRGVLSDSFSGSKGIEGLLRVSSAALIAHNAGVRYNKKNLLTLSVKWACEAVRNGWMHEGLLEEYVAIAAPLALKEMSPEDLRKAFSKNGVRSIEIPAGGSFDPMAAASSEYQYSYRGATWIR